MSQIPNTGLFFAGFLAVVFRGCVIQGPQLPRPTADVLSERLGCVPRDRSEERGLPSLPTGSFLLNFLATAFAFYLHDIVKWIILTIHIGKQLWLSLETQKPS
jgi:hypothetical protein